MRSLGYFLLCVLFIGCQGSGDGAVIEDTASQQVGEVMASIDEMSGLAGSFNLQSAGDESLQLQTTCGALTWGSCVNNVKIRTFSACTLGRSTLNGSVTLTYIDASTDNTCSIPTAGNSVSRAPNFTIQGARGGIVSLTTTGSFGQRITRTGANTFQFTNDGITRTLTSGSVTYAEYTTTTASAIGLTGNSRSNRIINGGSLQVKNNLTGEICTFVPSTVAYSGTCTCAVSGVWNFVCDAASGLGSLTLTGCGTAELTVNSTTSPVEFDRCQSLL